MLLSPDKGNFQKQLSPVQAEGQPQRLLATLYPPLWSSVMRMNRRFRAKIESSVFQGFAGRKRGRKGKEEEKKGKEAEGQRHREREG